MPINYKKLRALLPSKKVLSLSLISSLFLLYFSYKAYKKYRKRRKIYYDLYFFSQIPEKSPQFQPTLSNFLTNLRYNVVLAFNSSNFFGGTVKISFFLTQSFENPYFCLEFCGQSVHGALINGKSVENLVFERHILRIASKNLRLHAKNSLVFTFLGAFSLENAGFIRKIEKNGRKTCVFLNGEHAMAHVFPCFRSVDAKFTMKLAISLRKEWKCVSSLDGESGSARKIAKKRAKLKEIADFQEIPKENASFREFVQETPINVLGFALSLGNFEEIELKLGKSRVLRAFFSEKFKENALILCESREILSEIASFFEDFFGFSKEIRLVFVENPEENALFLLDEAQFLEFFKEIRRFRVLFAITHNISQLFCATVMKLAFFEETAVFHAFSRVLALKCFEKVSPEGLFALNPPNFVEKLDKNLHLLGKWLENDVFREITRDFIARTAIFGLKLKEFEFCLRKSLGNSEIFQGESASFASFRVIASENGLVQGVRLGFSGEMQRNIRKFCVFRVFFLYFVENSKEIREKSVEIRTKVEENEVFCDISKEKLRFPDFFLMFREDLPQFAGDLRLLSRHFHELPGNFLKNLAFSLLSRGFSSQIHGNSEDFAEFLENFQENRVSQQLFERVACFFLDFLDKKLDFCEQTRYFAVFFAKTLGRLRKSSKISEFEGTFLVLLSYLREKSHIELAISWIFEEKVDESPIFAQFLAQMLGKPEIFWEILGKLFSSSDFPRDFKEKTLENALKLKKFANFSDELAKKRCFSRFPDVEVKLSLLESAFSSKSRDEAAISLRNGEFYEGISKKNAEKLAFCFIKCSFLVFLEFPEAFCRRFFQTFKVGRGIRANFLDNYQELRDFLRENGVKSSIFALFQREIQEIEQEIAGNIE